MIRNLVYYAYINLDNISKYIHHHLFLLRKYKDIFNGDIIIYIATDDIITNDVEIKLKDYFHFLNAEIKVVKNNPENRESEYFIEQISKIKNKDSITFYSHTKGSTYDDNDNVLKWIISMYFFNLENDNLKKIENNLIDNIFSGIFRVDFPCPPWILSTWHYSGTMFWFNTSRLFSRDWMSLKKGRFSIESYPGTKSSFTESCVSESLFNEYTNSFLPKEYNRHDIRYDFYWENVFNEKLISNKKLESFNNLLNDVKSDYKKLNLV